MNAHDTTAAVDFVRTIVAQDVASGRWGGHVLTRFPPEPNGYPHIGHAKSICLNFTLALEHNGRCNLRFDDTNPSKESSEYVEAFLNDVGWLGFEWGEPCFTSDYFEQLYGFAVQLIEAGKAYVDDLSAEDIRTYRGTLTLPGKNSPYRDRPLEENLDLFERMRSGEFEEGTRVLRAKIDMGSPNLNLRDPVMYRILHATHHRTGDRWHIYPTYDWAHGQSDAIEGITHSICTLEFEDHRPLYDWFLDQLQVHHPRQIEFAPLSLSHTLLSKRKLRLLVEEGYVSGWDDPRMPTLAGMRRRGYTPQAIRAFCEHIGVTKSHAVVDIAQLEHALREDLNQRATRVMAVLHPLKVVITNYPEGKVETLEAINNPEDEGAGTRALPFSREVFIERADFLEQPPKKFFRLAPGREVRLKHAYLITCDSVIKDEASGEVVELRCHYDPASRGGQAPDGRKVKGTLHWVSVPHAVDATVRLYDHLFLKHNPEAVDEGQDVTDNLNPRSLSTLEGCKVEPGLANAKPGERFQFLRQGYFCLDPDSVKGQPVFNRTVSLRDSWARMAQSKA